MPVSLLSLKNVWKKIVLLFTVGLVVSVVRMGVTGAAEGTYLTDALFTIGSVFLFFGLGGLVKNLGMFNSLKYGTKCLLHIVQGKRHVASDQMVGGYMEYVKSRPKAKDVPWTLACAAAFLIFSALFALPML